VVHGLKSAVRLVLWMILRIYFRLIYIAETGEMVASHTYAEYFGGNRSLSADNRYGRLRFFAEHRRCD